MPEWSNGAVSKTVELLVGSGGSNPPLSAEDEEKKAVEFTRTAFFSSSSAKPAAGGRGCATEGSKSPKKEGDGRQSRPFFYPLPNLPLGEGLVASLREGSVPVFRQIFLYHLAAHPFSFHNGTNSCIYLPLWKEQMCSPSESDKETAEFDPSLKGGDKMPLRTTIPEYVRAMSTAFPRSLQCAPRFCAWRSCNSSSSFRRRRTWPNS